MEKKNPTVVDKILRVILPVFFFIVFFYIFVGDVIHTQTCTTVDKNTNLSCEEEVAIQAKSCKYTILFWKSVEPSQKDIDTCKKLRNQNEVGKTESTSERDAFVNSVLKLNKAGGLSNDLSSGKFVSQKETEKEMYTLAEDGISLSKQVSDSFLDGLNPNLRKYYREKFIRGNELWLEGTKEDNADGVKKQLLGVSLMQEWTRWFDKNGKSFEDKIF